MEYILVIVLLSIALFLVFHLRSLSDDEIVELGTKRRNKKVTVYFSHDNVQYFPNKDAKKAMPPFGGFFPVDWSFKIADPIFASLLKSKKHEWVVIAFEKQRMVQYLWMNKGADKSSVGLGISVDKAQDICKQSGYTSVLVFHNHINPRPSSYSTAIPSPKDLESANEWSLKLSLSNISLVEYICERGVPYRYFLNVSDVMFPLGDFLSKIKQENGISWSNNLSLHMERIF